MCAWTAPRTWTAGEVVTKALMDEQIRDNMLYLYHKNTLDAVDAPDANDDVTTGYSVGSLWIDVTADKVYMCVDETDGAAVWKQLSP